MTKKTIIYCIKIIMYQSLLLGGQNQLGGQVTQSPENQQPIIIVIIVISWPGQFQYCPGTQYVALLLLVLVLVSV